jgi:hypothetical protein
LQWADEGDHAEAAHALSDREWESALAFTDRFQLTLFVEGGPAWVRERIERDRARNRDRISRILASFRELRQAAAGLGIVVLKGFAHWDLFPVNPQNRVQYDIDLYSPDDVARMRDVLLDLGYATGETEWTLALRSAWKWNGDFYDPAIPIAIDLHARLWNEQMEGFAAPGIERFWSRRQWQSRDGLRYQSLAPVDALAFSTLHMLRHLLHGDARPAQAYELAHLLDHRRHDDPFWREWRELHPPELRRLEAVGFRLAAEWFGCPMHEAARSEIDALPAAIRRWFDRCAASGITAFFKPNKDDLSLNLCLIHGAGRKARVVRRRLFPARLPKPFSYAFARGIFHLRALAPAVSTMLRMRR